MGALAALTAARARIADPSAWSKYRMALSADGKEIDAADALARRWCAYGALAAEGAAFTSPPAALLRRAAWDTHRCGPIGANIYLGHAAILAVYDHAIALAAAEAEAR